MIPIDLWGGKWPKRPQTLWGAWFEFWIDVWFPEDKCPKNSSKIG